MYLMICHLLEKYHDILLMAEILHQLIGRLSHYLQGFIHAMWLAGFLNHQQYHLQLLFFEMFVECVEGFFLGGRPVDGIFGDVM